MAMTHNCVSLHGRNVHEHVKTTSRVNFREQCRAPDRSGDRDPTLLCEPALPQARKMPRQRPTLCELALSKRTWTRHWNYFARIRTENATLQIDPETAAYIFCEPSQLKFARIVARASYERIYTENAVPQMDPETVCDPHFLATLRS